MIYVRASVFLIMILAGFVVLGHLGGQILGDVARKTLFCTTTAAIYRTCHTRYLTHGTYTVCSSTFSYPQDQLHTSNPLFREQHEDCHHLAAVTVSGFGKSYREGIRYLIP